MAIFVREEPASIAAPQATVDTSVDGTGARNAQPLAPPFSLVVQPSTRRKAQPRGAKYT
jgi:hypothetical protein